MHGGFAGVPIYSGGHVELQCEWVVSWRKEQSGVDEGKVHIKDALKMDDGK